MEEKEITQTSETGATEQSYASALSEALSKKDAENRALKEAWSRERKELTEMIVNRVPAEEEKVEQYVIPTDNQIQEMRKELFTEDNEMTNLEYCTKALALREAVLAKTGKDIFVGQGSNFEPTQEDYYRAENTAEIYKECIEYANGDNEAFTTELMRRTKR